MRFIYTEADRERFREYGAQGGKKAAQCMSKKQRVERARKAVQARENKKKEVAQ